MGNRKFTLIQPRVILERDGEDGVIGGRACTMGSLASPAFHIHLEQVDWYYAE